MLWLLYSFYTCDKHNVNFYNSMADFVHLVFQEDH